MGVEDGEGAHEEQPPEQRPSAAQGAFLAAELTGPQQRPSPRPRSERRLRLDRAAGRCVCPEAPGWCHHTFRGHRVGTLEAWAHGVAADYEAVPGRGHYLM